MTQQQKKFTRSISRPFADLTNLIRSPTNGAGSLHKKKKKRKDHSPNIPRSTFQEQFSSQFPNYSRDSLPDATTTSPQHFSFESISIVPRPPSPPTTVIDPPPTQARFGSLPHDDDEPSFPPAVEATNAAVWSTRRYRECSPVLEEAETSSSFFSTHQTVQVSPPRPWRNWKGNGNGVVARNEESDEEHLASNNEEDGEEREGRMATDDGEEEIEESFVTAREGELYRTNSSPVKKDKISILQPEWQDAEEDDSQESPTSSFASSQLRREEGSEGGGATTTPNTSFPSTPGGGDSRDCGDERSEWLSSTPSKPDLLSLQHFTPPKLPPRFVEVVETCPTPEQQLEQQASGQDQEEEFVDTSPTRNRYGRDREEEARRRRSLLRSSELGGPSYYEGDLAAVRAELSGFDIEEDEERAARRYSYISPTTSHLDLHRSYAPSLVQGIGPDSTPSTPRRRRSPRSRQTTTESTRSDLFPTISATELVVASLLSSRSLATSPTTSQPLLEQQAQRYSSYSNYFDPSLPIPRRSPSPLKHTRPLSQSLAHSQQHYSQGHTAPLSQTLLPKSSSATLFTYDLSHLPAPSTPLEKPYRVSFLDVLKPSGYLGGGRGSGKFGDRWGAVERKTEMIDSSRSRRRSLRSINNNSSLWGIQEDETTGGRVRVDTPIPNLSSSSGNQIKRSGSIRRSLSKLKNRLSLSSADLDRVIEEREEGQEGEEGVGRSGTTKVERSRSIRKSLSRSLSTFSISGRCTRETLEEKERRERERLDQWVNVVVT